MPLISDPGENALAWRESFDEMRPHSYWFFAAPFQATTESGMQDTITSHHQQFQHDPLHYASHHQPPRGAPHKTPHFDLTTTRAVFNYATTATDSAVFS